MRGPRAEYRLAREPTAREPRVREPRVRAPRVRAPRVRGAEGAGAEGAGAEGAGADCAGTDGSGFDGPGTLITVRRGRLDEPPGSEEPVDSVAVRTTGTATVSASDTDTADPADAGGGSGGVSAWATIPAPDAGSTPAPPASVANAAAAGGTAAASGGGASLAAAGAGMTAVPRPSGGTPTVWSAVLTVLWLTSPRALVPMTALRASSAPAVTAMPWAVPPDSSLRTSRARGTTGRSRAWEARRPSRRSRAPTEMGPSYETWGYETWGREPGRSDERSSRGAGAGATGSRPFAGERGCGAGRLSTPVLARVTEAAAPHLRGHSHGAVSAHPARSTARREPLPFGRPR